MPRVFISYSHKDREWKDKVVEPLRALERNGHFDVWADDQIGVGNDWKQKIKESIDSSNATVLLITNSFLNSDFINGKELPQIMKRKKRAGMRVFPLIVRPCPWQAIDWLARMQVRPAKGRPLVLGDEYDIEQDLADLAREVLQKLKAIKIKSEPRVKPRRKTKKRRTSGSVRVGIVSLDTGLRGWPRWLRALNNRQSHIEFCPSTKRLPVRAIGDVKGEEQLKIYRLRKKFQMAMIGARDTATIGLTRHTLAFEKGEDILYNHLGTPSAVDDRLSFLSLGDLAGRATRAKVSLRAAFGYSLASHLAWRLGGRHYHKKLRGCPMDFTEHHEDKVPGLKAGRFCDGCVKYLKRTRNTGLLKALDVILEYGR